MSIPLATARKYADKIVAELAPFCERVEIAVATFSLQI